LDTWPCRQSRSWKPSAPMSNFCSRSVALPEIQWDRACWGMDSSVSIVTAG
jgi:hypothetical protein